MASVTSMKHFLCYSFLILIPVGHGVEEPFLLPTTPSYSRRRVQAATGTSDIPSITPTISPSSAVISMMGSSDIGGGNGADESDQPSLSPSKTPTTSTKPTQNHAPLLRQPGTIAFTTNAGQSIGPSMEHSVGPSSVQLFPSVSPTFTINAITALPSDQPSSIPASATINPIVGNSGGITEMTTSDAPSLVPTTFNTKAPAANTVAQVASHDPALIVHLTSTTPPTSSTSPSSVLPQAPSSSNSFAATAVSAVPSSPPITTLTPQQSTPSPAKSKGAPSTTRPSNLLLISTGHPTSTESRTSYQTSLSPNNIVVTGTGIPLPSDLPSTSPSAQSTMKKPAFSLSSSSQSISDQPSLAPSRPSFLRASAGSSSDQPSFEPSL